MSLHYPNRKNSSIKTTTTPEWIEGSWLPEDYADLQPVEDSGCEWVWVYLNTEGGRVRCSSVDSLDFHLATVVHAFGSTEGVRWWWKPMSPAPEAPKCEIIKRKD